MHPNWKLVAASDSQAAPYNPEGLDALALQKFKEKGGRFKSYEGAEIISNDDLLALDVDVLVLAGLEDSVTPENVMNIRARYVVELANGPVTDKAFDTLHESGVTILPDVIANAGGVIVSYLEWKQNMCGEHCSKHQVNQELERYMHRAVKATYKTARTHQTDLKSAAFIIALQKLND